MKFCDGADFTIINHMPACKRGDERRRVTKWVFAKMRWHPNSLDKGLQGWASTRRSGLRGEENIEQARVNELGRLACA